MKIAFGICGLNVALNLHRALFRDCHQYYRRDIGYVYIYGHKFSVKRERELRAVIHICALIKSTIKCEIRVTRSFGISTDGSESIIQYKNANV